MSFMHSWRAAVPGAFALLLFATQATAQIDVTTERYDDARLGANLSETQLTTANVNTGAFGKLWSYTVSGSVYAQPLYVRNVEIPDQGTHNVVYIVTMNDWVYAFDADAPGDAPLLSFDLTTLVPGSRANTILEILGYNDNVIGNVGIESTPHIDLATNTMYLVARTLEQDDCIPPNPGPNPTRNPKFCQRLHALDIRTLEEKPGSPVILGGSVPGSGGGSVDGTVTFDPKIAHQRASLALANGRLFIAWAGHSDRNDYHGWVMVYDATSLQQTKIWSPAPSGGKFFGGGIWMGGRAPAVDAAGSVYFMVGNGPWDGVDNFGESFLKFGPTADTPLLDWFTPNEVGDLNNGDIDLGGSGPILVPGTDLITGAGKGGKFYLTQTSSMGHLGVGTGNTNIVQAFSNGGQQIKGGPVYWNRAGGLGPWMYVWPDGHTKMKAYRFNGTAFDTTPASQSTLLSGHSSAGGVLTLSANGSTPGTGIIWSSMANVDPTDPNSGINAGILRAIDADDLTHELWNSEQAGAQDSMGNWPKFSPPTVVNGRVYLGSFPDDGVGDTKVNVYGLQLTPDFTLGATPPNPALRPGESAVYAIATDTLRGFVDPVHLEVSGVPAGATATFAQNDFSTPGSTTLTVQTDAASPLGEYVLTITATSGTLSHASTVGLYLTNAQAGAGVIGVDFVGSGVALGALETAGLLKRPNWNETTGASGFQESLVDETGTVTSASVNWNASAVWRIGIADEPGDARMMNGYLDATDAATTITVSGLPKQAGGYYVYVYADGDNGGSERTGDYSMDGGPPVRITDAADANFDGDFAPGQNAVGNYAVFFVAGSSFSLHAMPGLSSDGNPRAPVNAIQIVPGDRIFGNGFD